MTRNTYINLKMNNFQLEDRYLDGKNDVETNLNRNKIEKMEQKYGDQEKTSDEWTSADSPSAVTLPSSAYFPQFLCSGIAILFNESRQQECKVFRYWKAFLNS
jgi:hypothetical protein